MFTSTKEIPIFYGVYIHPYPDKTTTTYMKFDKFGKISFVPYTLFQKHLRNNLSNIITDNNSCVRYGVFKSPKQIHEYIHGYEGDLLIPHDYSVMTIDLITMFEDEDIFVKVFMSHAMSNLTEEQVLYKRKIHMDFIKKKLYSCGKIPIFIDNYYHEDVPDNAGSLWHLGTSIRQMEEANYIYFCDRVPDARGCLIEREISRMYQLKVLNDDIGYIDDKESFPVNYENENMGVINSVNKFTSPYQEIYELIGEEGTMKLFDLFKGRQMTFPQRVYTTDYVTQYVKAHYNTKNLKELAEKFNYSERRIREFLKVDEVKDEKVLTRDLSNTHTSMETITRGPVLDSNAIYYLKPYLSGYITMTKDNGNVQYLVCKNGCNEGKLVSEIELISLFQDYLNNRHLYKKFIIVPKEEDKINNFEVHIEDGNTSFSIGHKMLVDIIKPYIPIPLLYLI